MKPLNPIQEQFIKSRLLPFAETVGESEFVVVTLEEVLKRKQYDEIDKLVIEFAINKMKENLYEIDPS